MADKPTTEVKLDTKPQAGNGKEPSKHFQWLTLVGVPIICVLLGALLTVLVTWYTNRVRTLDYTLTGAQGILKKPDLEGKQFQASVDGRPVDNLSTFTVTLFNATDADFDDVPVEITLEPIRGVAPRVVQARASVPPSVPLSPQTQPSTMPSQTIRYEYMVKVMNRGASPVFTADFTLEGSELCPVNVVVRKKGLATNRKELSQPTTVWIPIFYAVLAVGTLTNLFFYFAWRRERDAGIENEKKHKQRWEWLIKELPGIIKESFAEAKAIIEKEKPSISIAEALGVSSPKPDHPQD